MQMNCVTEKNNIPKFSLFGGPLHNLGRRLGLVKNETNTIRLGIALCLLTWGVLATSAILLGRTNNFFSLDIIGVHVRLLIAMPLFFLCETLIAPRMTAFVDYLVSSNIILENEQPILSSIIRRVARLKESWIAEIVFVVIVFILPFAESFIATPGRTSQWVTLLTTTDGKFGLLIGWYATFCLPFFRFLLLRWIWHMILWWYFLGRVRKLNLNLMPTHPDSSGGLGCLEVVQEHFIPLIMAISAVYSAAFAENLTANLMVFESLYLYLFVLLLIITILFIGPLFMFSYKLWHARSTGLQEYMSMAAKYVNAFDRKWIRNEKATGESQLGTSDMQSLADLTNSVNVIRKMGFIPASQRLLLEFAIALVIPLLPLILFKYPIDQIAEKLFQILY